MFDFSPLIKYYKYYLCLVLILTLSVVNLQLKSDIYSLNNEHHQNNITINNTTHKIEEQKEEILKLSDEKRIKSIAKELNLHKTEKIKIS
jgi:hypothetical protein